MNGARGGGYDQSSAINQGLYQRQQTRTEYVAPVNMVEYAQLRRAKLIEVIEKERASLARNEAELLQVDAMLGAVKP